MDYVLKCPKCFHEMWYKPYIYDLGKVKRRHVCYDCGGVFHE